MTKREHTEVTTLAGKPATILPHLESVHDVYVLCRLQDGQDAHVPLRELFRLFEVELAPPAHVKGSEPTSTGTAKHNK